MKLDLKNDADEMTNLYANPEYQAVVEKLKSGLKDLIGKYEDPVELPNL